MLKPTRSKYIHVFQLFVNTMFPLITIKKFGIDDVSIDLTRAAKGGPEGLPDG